MNPDTTVKAAFIPSVSDNSTEGKSRDQKAAAIITPPAKASIESMIFLSGFLKTNTSDAPAAVILQVNKVAISAIKTQFKMSSSPKTDSH